MSVVGSLPKHAPVLPSRHTAVPDALPTDPRIVVAVGAGPASARALAWAADESLCRGMSVRVVSAFAEQRAAIGLTRIEQALACQRRLCDWIRRTRPWLDDVEQIVRRGSLTTLLAEAARPEDIVVIDAASATRELLDGLTCPVVLVPPGLAGRTGVDGDGCGELPHLEWRG
jgi:hypothetical protein